MKLFAVLALVGVLASGCLDNGPEPDTAVGPEASEVVEVPLMNVDESFDLLLGSVDQSWSWSMSDNMTGRVQVTYIGEPVGLHGTNSICYRLAWPEGEHYGGSNCGGGNFGNVNIAPGATLSQQTVYEAGLVPNEFTLRVWNTAGPDTATVRVQVHTSGGVAALK